MTFRINSQWFAKADQVQDSVQQSAVSTLQSAEDEATLGELGIHVGLTCLTQAIESETNKLRDGANLPAYRLAEWLAWHWWRLRWEPARQRPRDVDWSMAHDLASIGGGWLWPNITIKSDGERILFHARPSRIVETEPLRFTSDAIKFIPVEHFEEGIDRFVASVLARLKKRKLKDTDLHSIWSELNTERQDKEISQFRKFEAYLGFDPDEAEPVLIERLIEQGAAIGLDAMSEVAADDPQSALGLHDMAQKLGFDIRPGDVVQNVSELLPVDRSQVPAWKVGVDLAHQLRLQESLGDEPISNTRLAELSGMRKQDLSSVEPTRNIAFAFALDGENSTKGRVVLRSAGEQGRRFAVARLLADRLLDKHNELLHPATGTYTYRQKLQRAFAGEFLSPVNSLLSFLNDDFTDEKQQDAADYFNVSPLAVQTLLVNNDYLDIEESELQDLEAIAA